VLETDLRTGFYLIYTPEFASLKLGIGLKKAVKYSESSRGDDGEFEVDTAGYEPNLDGSPRPRKGRL
jgi:hypothetical protein